MVEMDIVHLLKMEQQSIMPGAAAVPATKSLEVQAVSEAAATATPELLAPDQTEPPTLEAAAVLA
jgi:hypothetical protein